MDSPQPIVVAETGSDKTFPCTTGEGLLLVGHGTRDAAGQEEFLKLASLVSGRRSALIVEPCYLEFAGPTIAQGVDRAVARGAHRLTVAPILLFAAGHAKQDIPAAVMNAAARHAGLTVRQLDPLECDDKLLAL